MASVANSTVQFGLHVRSVIKSVKHADDNNNNNKMMVMGMNQKAKRKSYLDKGPAKEQLERRSLIKGRLFENDDDEDIDFTIPTKKVLSPLRGGKPKADKIVWQKQITKPKAQRSIGLSNIKSSSGDDLQTMRRQSRIMAEMEPKEKATPMENAVRQVRERKALRKSKSDDTVLFAMRKAIPEQDTSGPGFLSKHEDNNNNKKKKKMVMGMNQKGKKSYLDKGPAKEQLERRKLIKGRLFENDDDEDIDFTIPTKRVPSPLRGRKPKTGKIVWQKKITKPEGRRSIGLSDTKSLEDLPTMRRQSRIMAELALEPEEKATPIENAVRRGRERKALRKSKSSDAGELFAMRKSTQEQGTSSPGLLSRGLKLLENLYEDCA